MPDAPVQPPRPSRKRRLIIAAAFTILLVAGWQFFEATSFYRNAASLKLGMTRADVIALMGRPDEAEKRSKSRLVVQYITPKQRVAECLIKGWRGLTNKRFPVVILRLIDVEVEPVDVEFRDGVVSMIRRGREVIRPPRPPRRLRPFETP